MHKGRNMHALYILLRAVTCHARNARSPIFLKGSLT